MFKQLAVAAAFAALSAGSAQAIVVVDQSLVTSPGGAQVQASLFRPDEFRRAQSFTVGIDGFLNSVRIFHYDSNNHFTTINILDSLEGTGHIVGSSTTINHQAYSTVFDVRQLNIQAQAGQVFAFEIIGGQDTGPSSLEVANYKAYNPGPDGYTRGSDYVWNPEFGMTSFTPTDTDALFVTTIDAAALPVPEPESYAMLIAGLGLLSVAAKRRRA